MTLLSQVAAAARVTAGMLAAVAPVSAFKASPQSSANSTTLAGDSALLIPLAAAAVYEFELVLGYQGGTLGSSDLKIGWSLPSGATMGYGACGNTTGGAATDAPWYTASDTPAFGTAGSGVPVSLVLSGTVANGSSAGTMQLEWAKNSTTDATVTTLLAGCVLLAWQVA